MLPSQLPDFYGLLQIHRNASPSDIKIAYHRTLLRLHPDKQPRSCTCLEVDVTKDTTSLSVTPPLGVSVDMALVKEAYRTLSDVSLRVVYDRSLRREEHTRSHGPRPAQVVSLEEFSAFETTFETGTDMGATQEWLYGCRCGGAYRITLGDLENGTHLVGCESCSEVIWAGYEEATGDEDVE